MTMPHERTKSLRWAYELLADLDADQTVPEHIRIKARVVVQTFPAPRVIQSLIESNAERLPPEMSETTEEARILFGEVQGSGAGSPTTRKDLLYTLRHFPSSGAIRSAAKMSSAGGIQTWVALEGG